MKGVPQIRRWAEDASRLLEQLADTGGSVAHGLTASPTSLTGDALSLGGRR